MPEMILVTPALRSAIYQAAKKKVFGASPLFECGIRETPEGYSTENSLLWNWDEADLEDFTRLAELKTIMANEKGECELDLYATTTHRSSIYGKVRELETNVYVRFNPTGVLSVYSVGETPP